MRHRHHKLATFLLALLFAASSWVPMPGRAQAQMRCAGASPQSAPCARAELPAAGLTEKQVYGALMACCRPMRGGCAAMPACPMRHPSPRVAASHRGLFASRVAPPARRCLVSVRILPSSPTTPAHRLRWLLTASPALAPPVTASAVVPTPQTVPLLSWTGDPALFPHAAPIGHGLRAPPVT